MPLLALSHAAIPFIAPSSNTVNLKCLELLVLGATGYLGSNLANILVREGQHTVYGVARSPENVAQLAKEEVLPIQCDDSVGFHEQLASHIYSNRIDTILDVASANEGSLASFWVSLLFSSYTCAIVFAIETKVRSLYIYYSCNARPPLAISHRLTPQSQ